MNCCDRQKMDNLIQFSISSLQKDITENKLQLQATIQEINACKGPLAELHSLNNIGRSKISALRKHIQKFGDIAKENKSESLLKDVLLQREQLSCMMESFKKANIRSMLAIEQGSKSELFAPGPSDGNGTVGDDSEMDATGVRRRQHHDKKGIVQVSSNVTEQLLTISRQLADTTQRSADTLGTLVTSSDSVQGTQEELQATGGAIGQSGKLLAKYGRREFTDKVLMFFAFAFFIACVLYIVQKRLF